jgi:hypothetical protein
VVRKKAAGAVDGRHARCDGLVQRQGSGIAVMGSRCLELRIPVLSLSLFTFSVGYLFLLLQGAMALLVQLSVAIEGAASTMEWLGVHDASIPKRKKIVRNKSTRDGEPFLRRPLMKQIGCARCGK